MHVCWFVWKEENEQGKFFVYYEKNHLTIIVWPIYLVSEWAFDSPIVPFHQDPCLWLNCVNFAQEKKNGIGSWFLLEAFEPQPLCMVAFVVPCLRCVRAFEKLHCGWIQVGEKKVDWCIIYKNVVVNRKRKKNRKKERKIEKERENWKRKKMWHELPTKRENKL